MKQEDMELEHGNTENEQVVKRTEYGIWNEENDKGDGRQTRDGEDGGWNIIGNGVC